MDALILGGNSPHNREWIQQLETALKPLFGKTATHEYAHWASADASIDFEHELPIVRRETHELGDYVVIAKSVGVLLTLRGIAENIIRPEKIILLGTPLNYVRKHAMEHDFEQWLEKVNEPMLLVQNAHDPVARANEIDHYFKEHLSPSLISFAELPGEGHDYVDFPKLYELTASFLANSPPSSR